MEKIKDKLRNTKVQCSGATKEVKEVFAKLGIDLPDSDFVYIDKDLKAEKLTPSLFKIADCEEVCPAKLKAEIEKAEKVSIKWKEGSFFVAESDGEKSIGLVLTDLGEKVLALSQYWTGDLLLDRAVTFNKSIIRHANAAEVAKLTSQLKIAGYKVEICDGKLDTFWLRPVGQEYWTVKFNAKIKTLVSSAVEEWDDVDTYRYKVGNYFKTKENAIKAIKDLLNK